MRDEEFRMERIEKLIKELTYEVQRGLREGEIPEQLTHIKVHPKSREIKGGVVNIEFRIWPSRFPLNMAEGREHAETSRI